MRTITTDAIPFCYDMIMEQPKIWGRILTDMKNGSAETSPLMNATNSIKIRKRR